MNLLDLPFKIVVFTSSIENFLPASCSSAANSSDLERSLASKACDPCHHTVDGQNPAPPRMMTIPLFIGF